jgi:hypothetical protein
LEAGVFLATFKIKMNTTIAPGIHTNRSRKFKITSNPVQAIGTWSALLSLVFALGYVGAQLFSWLKLITYPGEMFWLFLPSLFLAPSFLITMICLHYMASDRLKVWTSIAAAFAIVYCSFATLTYFTQLGSIVPSLMRGEIGETYPLIFKPRSYAMSIDCLGYFFMSLSTLFAAFAFRHADKNLYGWMLFNGLLLLLFIPAYFETYLYYFGSVWAVSFSMSMIYAARLFREKGEVAG